MTSLKIMRFIGIFIGLCYILLLTACQPVGGHGQTNVGPVGVLLGPNVAIGQTFVSTFRGLTGVRVHLSPSKPGSGKIVLVLYADQGKNETLAQTDLLIGQVDEPGFFTFVFEKPITNPRDVFYLELQSIGDGQVRVGTADPASYLDGSLYQDGIAQASQLSFMPIYDPIQMAVGLFGEIASWVGWLLVSIFAFLLPGWALLDRFAEGWARRLPFGSRLSLAVACSLTLYPVLFLMAYLVGAKIGIFIAFIPGIVALAYLGFQLFKTRGEFPRFLIRKIPVSSLLPALGYLFTLGWVVFIRLWAVRTLTIPMWGDSVHHTMITELIIRNQGLFQSWQPLAEMQSLTYHFGFHTLAAVFHWLTGLDSPRAVLVTGQILNVLAVLAIYPLAAKAARQNPWAGIAAMVVAGCLVNMPMYYTNWGRYTQLAGQVILCGAIYLLWELFETESPQWRLAVLVGLVWGGLALTHYRVMIFAVFAVPALMVFYSGKLNWKNLWQRYRYLFAAGITAGVIFLPWFIHVYGGMIYARLVSQVTTAPKALSDFDREYNAIGPIASYLPLWIWASAALAAVWGFLRRQKEILVVCTWALLVLFAANPGWFSLPGSGALSNFAIFIAAYIFAAILIGAAVGWIACLHAARMQIVAGLILLFGLVGVGVFFGRHRLHDLGPEVLALETQSDIRAAKWVEVNTPSDARFVVNSFFAYGGSVVVGSDGGWWIPQLAHRLTTLPPMLYTSETEPYPGFIRGVNQLRQLIEDQGYTSPQVVRALWDNGVRYAYIGQRGGRVNYAGPVVMDGTQMVASGLYKVVYHRDLVWVLEILKRP